MKEFFLSVVAMIVVCVASPSVAFGGMSVSDAISHFQYDIPAGQSIDDALVVANTTAETQSFSVVAVDFLPDQVSNGGIRDSSAGQDNSLASWVRFFDPAVPDGSSEVREALVGKPVPRNFELCAAAQYGSIEKRDREQRVVRVLGRNLTPSEIGYLEELTRWCEGSGLGQVVLGPGETARIPFLVLVPQGVEPREYNAEMFIEHPDGSRVLSARVRETVPGARQGTLAITNTEVARDKPNEYRIIISYLNDGGMTARGAVMVGSHITLFRTAEIQQRFETELAPGGGGTTEFFVPKPFLGRIVVRASTEGSLASDLVLSELIVPWLGVLCVAVFILIALFVLGWRRYWKNLWVASLSGSWVPARCEVVISTERIAEMYQVPETLVSLLNEVRTGYLFQKGDWIRLPPFNLIVKKAQRVKSKKFRMGK